MHGSHLKEKNYHVHIHKRNENNIVQVIKTKNKNINISGNVHPTDSYAFWQESVNKSEIGLNVIQKTPILSNVKSKPFATCNERRMGWTTTLLKIQKK